MTFQRPHSGDLHANLAVSQEEARVGSSRVLNLPGGRTVTVQVHAGVSHGEEIRMRGLGDPNGPEGKLGDLILRIAIMPTERSKHESQDEPTMVGATEQMAAPHLPLLQPLPRLDYNASGAGHTQLENAGAYAAPTEQHPYAHVPDYGDPQAPPGYGSYPDYPAYHQHGGQVSPPQFLPPPPQPTRKRTGAVTAVITIIILALLVGSGLLFYFGIYQPDQVHITAVTNLTSTASSKIMGTADAAMTSTAQVQATAQAYQKAYTQVTSGAPTFVDSLSGQTNRQWDELTSSANGTCGFQDGSYDSKMPTVGYFQPCFAENINLSNFALQVDMAIIQGDVGGVLFRADNVNNKYYLFRISTNGSYELFVYTGNQASQAKVLLQGNTNLINPVGQVNSITLVAQGHHFSFYLNQKYLDGTNNGTYNSGIIGVFADGSDQATEAAFSTLKVWKL